MAERKGQDGQRFEDTPSLNIAMGEWGSEVHRSLHDVLFRVTHVLKFFVWRVVDSAIQACGGVRGTLGRMTNGALNRALGVLVARHSKKHCSWVESRELPPELTNGALNRNVCSQSSPGADQELKGRRPGRNKQVQDRAAFRRDRLEW